MRRLLPILADARREESDPEARLTVHQALKELPLRQRWAVALCDLSGFSGHEAAAILGVNDSTLRVHLARARAALRRALGNSDADSRDDGETATLLVSRPKQSLTRRSRDG